MKNESVIFSSLDDLWAKSSGERRGLLEHTEDVLEVLEGEIQRHQGLIQHVAEQLAAHFPQTCISTDDLVREVRLATLCHDLGKATVRFQKYLRAIARWKASGQQISRPKINYIHHRFASLPFIKAVTVAQAKKALYTRGHLHLGLGVVAVLTHHGRFSPYLEEQSRPRSWFEQRKMIQEQTDYVEVLLPDLWEWMNQHLRSWRYREAPWKAKRFEDLISEFDRWYAGLLGSEIKGYSGHQIHPEPIDRLALTLIKGLLMGSDWQASGHYRLPYEVLRKLEGYLYLGTARRAYYADRLANPKDFKWNRPQREMAETRGNALCVVACGQGKTEAAGLWAAADPQRRPVVYLLPTQVTSTKLADRLSEYLPRRDELKAVNHRKPVGPVGLIHGSARYHRLKDVDDDLADEIKRQLAASRCFALPVTVATVDQALMAFFNGSYWSQTMLRLAEANLIFDEIHAYEPYTLGLILSMIEQLHDLRARFAFLSATMPKQLQKQLKRAAGGALEIPRGRDPGPRWKLHFKEDHSLSELFPEAIRRFANGDKILVIANTIGHADELYEKVIQFGIPAEQRMLLHSMFMQRDRAEKESRLEQISKQERRFFLVATQVVEVSLDISFDFLLTEAATADALVQRLGRINRYGQNPPTDVWVAAQEERSKMIYESDLVRRSLQQFKRKGRDGILTEQDYRDTVDVVYEIQWRQADYQMQLQRGRHQAKQIQHQLSYIYDLTAEKSYLSEAITRPNDYPKVEVIPRAWEDGTLPTIEDEYKATCKQRSGLTLARGFLVRVPLWWLYKPDLFGKPRECRHGYILDIKYSRERGVLNDRTDNLI